MLIVDGGVVPFAFSLQRSDFGTEVVTCFYNQTAIVGGEEGLDCTDSRLDSACSLFLCSLCSLCSLSALLCSQARDELCVSTLRNSCGLSGQHACLSAVHVDTCFVVLTPPLPP
jgi:hypothetical protein